MSNLIKKQLANLSLCPLFFGGYLVFTPQSSQAQTALPNLYQIPNQQILPQLQPQGNQIVDFYTNNPINQNNRTTQANQFAPGFDKYIVYVNSDDRGILQRIKQIETSAYIREVNGVKFIQSGVFTRPDNAERRVRELASNGIMGAGILGSSNSGQLFDYNSTTVPNNNNNDNNKYSYNNSINSTPNIINNFSSNHSFTQSQTKYYYVVIPTSRNNLDFLGQEIQQKIGGNANVYKRYQPRGTHIAVGAFQERSDAEQWNDYLKSLGYGNARVYYGQ
ncbi:MAG: hypothetical protein EAZ76_01495 [Nostocales cyanobacterium]|nr:MAG: hypothetical protein EAZ87_05415 [Nostocales cyanobacterium]TAF20446.1 MAG: hypothetical protein EAZ76_01495 [Nostocales cyanobacterium]